MNNSIDTRHQRLLVIPRLLGLMALAGGFIVGLALRWDAAAQEPPPMARISSSASRTFADVPRQYDIVQMLLEFAPGAATPWHRVNGRGMFTVVSGEITRVEESGSRRVFTAGETFTEVPEDHFDYDANLSATMARLLATFVLIPGAEPLIIHPSLPSPGTKGPEFIALARTTVGTIPAEFSVVHGITDFPPGALAPLHTHDSWSMATGLSGGRATNIVDGVTRSVGPGEVFVHGPGQVHELLPIPQGGHSIMFVAIGPVGAPPLRPVATGTQSSATTAPASGAQTGTIRPPATGDGGLLGN